MLFHAAAVPTTARVTVWNHGNMPQFTGMKSIEDVDVWMKTIDPAWRHTKRDVPFMWGVAANDNWFLFPAVTATYHGSISKNKRMVIVPLAARLPARD